MQNDKAATHPPDPQADFERLKMKLREETLSSENSPPKRNPKQISIFTDEKPRAFRVVDHTEIQRLTAQNRTTTPSKGRKKRKNQGFGSQGAGETGEMVGIDFARAHLDSMAKSKEQKGRENDAYLSSPEFASSDISSSSAEATSGGGLTGRLTGSLFGSDRIDALDGNAKIRVAQVAKTNLGETGEESLTASKRNGVTAASSVHRKSDAEGFEYVSPTQNDEIEHKIAETAARLKILLIICLAMAAPFLFFAIRLFTRAQVGFYIANAALAASASGVCVFILRRELASAFISLMVRRPEPNVAAAFTIACTAIYNISLFITAASGGADAAPLPPPVAFPALIAAISVIISAWLDNRSKRNTFKIASSPKKKFAAVKLREGRRTASDPDKLYEISQTFFVDSLMGRERKRSVVTRRLGLVSSAAIAAAVFAGVLTAVFGNGAASLGYALLALSLCSPAPLFLCVPLQSYAARYRAAAYEGAIIGEGAEDEYADVPMILMEDCDLFPAEKIVIRDMKIYGYQPLDYVLARASAALTLTCSSLSEIFASAVGEAGQKNALSPYGAGAVILSQTQNGFTAAVEGGEITIGNSAYVSSLGIPPIYENGDDDPQAGTIMYIAEGGTLLLKFKIQYRPDEDFVELIRGLTSSGIEVGITTCDPNISEETLYRALKRRTVDNSVKILRRSEQSGLRHRTTANRLSAGVVSTHSAKAALHVLAICGKSAKIRRLSFAVTLLSSVIGGALAVAFAILGVPLTATIILLPFLYSLFWMLPITVLAAGT